MGGFDQNRDNVWLSSPASRANARILADYKPEICLDAHEYESNSFYGIPEKASTPDGGFAYKTAPVSGDRIVLRDAGGTLCYYKEQITTQWANHLIIPENLRNLSEVIQQKIANNLEKESNPTGAYYWAPYVDTRGYGLTLNGDGTAGGGLVSLDQIPSGTERDTMRKWADANGMVPELNAIARSAEGGFDPSIARNSMALIPGISFLVESRSAGGRWEYPRRVMAQYLTALYYIEAVLGDLDNIAEAIHTARADIIDAGRADNIGGSKYPEMVIAQKFNTENYSSVVTQGVYYDDGTSEDIIGRRANSRFGTVSTFQRKRPYAYVMDGDYIMADEIAFRMSNLDIEFQRTLEPIELEVMAYTVTGANSAPSFGATSRITGVSENVVTRTFPTGSYVFYMDQQMANFIALLFEPMSLRSWSGKDVKNVDVIVNKEVPFYRYEKTNRISPAKAVEIISFDFTNGFLTGVRPYSIAKLDDARDRAGVGDGYAETVVVYGGSFGHNTTEKAYLPWDGNHRTWLVLNKDKSLYTHKDVSFSAEMNRYYIELTSDEIVSEGNGSYTFDTFVTPRDSEIVSENESSGSGVF
jgi:hypothetical protein